MADNDNAAAVAEIDAPEDEELQWEPDRAPEDYDDDALKATPLFSKIRESCVYNVGGRKRYLPDTEVLDIARNALKEIWEARESGQDSEDVLALFGKFIERVGEEAVNESQNTLILTRVQVGDDDDGNPIWEGRAKLKSSGRGKRFGHDDYARLEGFGEDPESDLAKRVIAKLGGRYGGGFLLEKTGMKKASKNGIYEFRILPPKTVTQAVEGKPGETEEVENEVCSKFRAELHQYPEDGRKVAVIVFPPAGGDKKKCQVTDERVEVPSMSKMMKESEMAGAQTPAVVFGLADINLPDDDEPAEGGETPSTDASAAAAHLEEDDSE